MTLVMWLVNTFVTAIGLHLYNVWKLKTESVFVFRVSVDTTLLIGSKVVSTELFLNLAFKFELFKSF